MIKKSRFTMCGIESYGKEMETRQHNFLRRFMSKKKEYKVAYTGLWVD